MGKEGSYKLVMEISGYIKEGANSFLMQEYLYCIIFIVGMSIILYFAVDMNTQKDYGFWTTGSFICGSITSILSGYIGMKVAVYANSIVALTARHPSEGLPKAFVVAFRAGSVMGFCLTSLGLLILLIIVWFYRNNYPGDDFDSYIELYESVAGYGLGGSSIALFGRVGGGIYTKAADVGADLVGKVEAGLDEDSPKNPGTIADNVGDNVGDVAGMGADLFGSFAESSSATLVVASTIPAFYDSPGAMYFPIIISGFGIIVCIITSYFATDFMKVDEPSVIESTLKM